MTFKILDAREYKALKLALGIVELYPGQDVSA